NEDELAISHTFNNVCSDLNTTLLTNLNDQLILLEGSIIKSDNRKYYFYHPSMYDFFVHYLSKDIATYRNLLFKNINVGLLTLTRFITEPKTNCINVLKEDIINLTVGFQRLIHNPYISLIEINSLLAWLENPDVLINFKMKLHQDFNVFISELYNALCKIDFYRFQEEDAYHISNFFHRLKYLFVLTNKKIFISESGFKSLLLSNNNKGNYWLIVFSITPFLEEGFIYKNIGIAWLNSFYSQLKNEIDYLGNELYGDAYPNFEEVFRYKKLLEEKKFEEANLIKKKSIGDYKQKTNSDWYPRYTACKEKMSKLKGSHPYGFKIYQKLSGNFEHLRALEDNQKNRYLFNKSKKWW
ncbi:MAG: hypothetical protein KKB34_01100, partial [Bacteroidetes bacterium]|nr:hypothetical protein [Bacteroidota bacterium]